MAKKDSAKGVDDKSVTPLKIDIAKRDLVSLNRDPDEDGELQKVQMEVL